MTATLSAHLVCERGLLAERRWPWLRPAIRCCRRRCSVNESFTGTVLVMRCPPPAAPFCPPVLPSFSAFEGASGCGGAQGGQGLLGAFPRSPNPGASTRTPQWLAAAGKITGSSREHKPGQCLDGGRRHGAGSASAFCLKPRARTRRTCAWGWLLVIVAGREREQQARNHGQSGEAVRKHLPLSPIPCAGPSSAFSSPLFFLSSFRFRGCRARVACSLGSGSVNAALADFWRRTPLFGVTCELGSSRTRAADQTAWKTRKSAAHCALRGTARDGRRELGKERKAGQRATGAWDRPVTVLRGHRPTRLARDGAARHRQEADMKRDAAATVPTAAAVLEPCWMESSVKNKNGGTRSLTCRQERRASRGWR